LWTTNGGKCGICGEDFQNPKNFEKGGSMYRGMNVRQYNMSQIIDVEIVLTANHLGWHEFRLCSVDNRTTDADITCLNKTLLTDPTGKRTRFPAGNVTGSFSLKLLLPSGLCCKHCVFQVCGSITCLLKLTYTNIYLFLPTLKWKYHAGNNGGCDPVTKQCCSGCGTIQEEFYGKKLSSILIKKQFH
jgi:hypothetical protein